MVHATVLRISGERMLRIALLEEIAGAVIRVPIFILSGQLYPNVLGAGFAGTDRDVVLLSLL